LFDGRPEAIPALFLNGNPSLTFAAFTSRANVEAWRELSEYTLEMHGKIMDLMGLPQSHYAHINIHIGASTGGKQAAMDRFADNFMLLSNSVRSRLVVETDDRPSMYTVSDLKYLYDKIGTPITFDFFHHQCQLDPMSQEEAFKLAASTWPSGIAPSVHYSESKRLHENDSKIKVVAHSDYINELPNTYGIDVDIEAEVKMKELAILPFINKQQVLKAAK
jgi:UV DNA damage endonuclease